MRVDCKKCGAKILPSTYGKTGGLCMPCKGGYRSRISRSRLLGKLRPLRKAGEVVSKRKMRYVRLTEKVLRLDEEKLRSATPLLTECVVPLEEAAQSLVNPKKRRWWRPRIDSGQNWVMGAGLANCAAQVTEFLDGRNRLDLEERSATVWREATLAVCAHYHHLVGPAMVASAKIALKQGNTEWAKRIFAAVIEDFVVVLERCESENESLKEHDDDRIALASLNYSVDRAIELGYEVEAARGLRERISRVLAVSESKAP